MKIDYKRFERKAIISIPKNKFRERQNVEVKQLGKSQNIKMLKIIN